MQIGTDEEIMTQLIALEQAEIEALKARLRLRALKGEPLLQTGDSGNAAAMTEYLGVIVNEFGARNIQMF
jgi:hypothetical protein